MNNFCLCGYHVHTGTLLFGILALTHGFSNVYRQKSYFSSIITGENQTELLSVDFVEKYPRYKEYFVAENAILGSILICVSLILIIANCFKRPGLYWFFIMYMFFGYIVSILRILFVIGIFVWSSVEKTHTNRTKEVTELRRFEILAVIIINLLVEAVIQFYIAWVAERDRRYLLNDEEDLKMDDVQIET